MENKDLENTEQSAIKSSSRKDENPKKGKFSFSKGWISFVTIAALTIVFFAWFLWQLLRSEDNYRVHRQAMVAQVDGKTYMVSIVAHFQAFVVKKEHRSSVRKGVTEYYLTVNQLPDGELIAKKKLGSGNGSLSKSALRLFNISGSDLYLLAGKPLRVSLPNLEEKPLSIDVDENTLPEEYWQYFTYASENIVWIDLRDGKKAWLNPATGEIKSAMDENTPTPPANRYARQVRGAVGPSRPGYIDLITPWYFSRDSSLYYFSNPEEPLITISINALNRYQYQENEQLKLYKAPFKKNQRMGSTVVNDAEAIELSNETFLQAGFLKNENTGEAIHPSNGFLVASRTMPGEDGLLQLSWLDGQTGTIKYKETVTRIDNLKQVIFASEFIVIIGTEFGTAEADPGRDRIYVVLTEKGTLKKFDIQL